MLEGMGAAPGQGVNRGTIAQPGGTAEGRRAEAKEYQGVQEGELTELQLDPCL